MSGQFQALQSKLEKQYGQTELWLKPLRGLYIMECMLELSKGEAFSEEDLGPEGILPSMERAGDAFVEIVTKAVNTYCEEGVGNKGRPPRASCHALLFSTHDDLKKELNKACGQSGLSAKEAEKMKGVLLKGLEDGSLKGTQGWLKYLHSISSSPESAWQTAQALLGDDFVKLEWPPLEEAVSSARAKSKR